MANKAKLFGTDGIRGKANIWPMTAEVAQKVAMATALALEQDGKLCSRVAVIGKDTRISGYMIENAVTSGLAAMGFTVYLLGPTPTPSISALVKSLRADIGVMISASHNLYYDNGIKIFNSDGYKLSDKQEALIEELCKQDLSELTAKPDKIGKVKRLKGGQERYIEYLKSIFPKSFNLSHLRIVLDCSNGAAYSVAPMVFYELGADDMIVIGNQPNGLNINEGCGSTNIHFLKENVLQYRADIGIALDGDADRLIMVDSKGEIIDGDSLMALIAVYLKNQGRLTNNTIVTTVMSNMALEAYLGKNGIKTEKVAVGDRYVIDKLRSDNLNFGGEQSGHIILGDYSTTGDGILAALFVLNILMNHTQSFNWHKFAPYPQVLINVPVSKEQISILTSEKYLQMIADIESEIKDKGRVLVRKSGTEPLIRVMVEHQLQEDADKIAKKIVDFIRNPLS